ncbi:MAG: hypothetical protein AAB604_02080 [Patescibacteria group bacterium]
MVVISFQAVFGVNPGYAHDNKLSAGTTAAQIVARVWREELEKDLEEGSGILVGGTVTEGRTVYPQSFGCPEDGEVTAVVAGNTNPKFIRQAGFASFKRAVIRVAKATKARLAQSRVQITFTEVNDFVYLEPENSGGEQRWTA